MRTRTLELELKHFSPSRQLEGMYNDWQEGELSASLVGFVDGIFMPEVRPCDYSDASHSELVHEYPHFDLLNDEGLKAFFEQTWTETDADYHAGIEL